MSTTDDRNQPNEQSQAIGYVIATVQAEPEDD
ncbi:hypothetical protein J2Y42_003045 [Leifsonia sp. 1010]|nr:hypothetical protein [Leifsonia sp. 1010]